MAHFEVAVLLNEGEGRFEAYRPGSDKLVLGPVMATVVDTVDQALGAAWEMGNKQTAVADYPRNVRSVSSGDVLVVRNVDLVGFGESYAVAFVGFEKVAAEAVVASLTTGLPNSRG